MQSIRRVVVALSLTEADESLLRYAAMVAKMGTSPEFRFVHVLTDAHRNGKSTEPQNLKRRMIDLVTRHFVVADVDIECAYDICEGVRIDALLEYVTDNQADLVILGHRRNRSGRRSLARRLAMIGPCSVWMVPEDSPAQITRVLAPVDFSDRSAESLSKATVISHLRGLEECYALHVFFDESTIRYDEHVEEIRNRETHDLNDFLGSVNQYGVHVEPVFEESANIAEGILRCAQKYSVDLIVMNTRGRSRAASILLGSATSQTLIESPIPVFAVKQRSSNLNLFQVLRKAEFWMRPNPKTN